MFCLNFAIKITGNIKLSSLFSISDSIMNGEYLNITKVSRLHMAAYLCIASNGVQPSVSKRIMLNVKCKYLPWHIKQYYYYLNNNFGNFQIQQYFSVINESLIKYAHRVLWIRNIWDFHLGMEYAIFCVTRVTLG